MGPSIGVEESTLAWVQGQSTCSVVEEKKASRRSVGRETILLPLSTHNNRDVQIGGGCSVESEEDDLDGGLLSQGERRAPWEAVNDLRIQDG